MFTIKVFKLLLLIYYPTYRWNKSNPVGEGNNFSSIKKNRVPWESRQVGGRDKLPTSSMAPRMAFQSGLLRLPGPVTLAPSALLFHGCFMSMHMWAVAAMKVEAKEEFMGMSDVSFINYILCEIHNAWSSGVTILVKYTKSTEPFKSFSRSNYNKSPPLCAFHLKTQ